MPVIPYHKLVRDLIPDIIVASGKTCVTETLSDEDYLRMVDAKLDEELAEYHREPCLEELADLVEVIYAAAKARGYSLEELERVRTAKAAERGAFERKILLKEVSQQNEDNSLLKVILANKDAIFERIDSKMLMIYCWLEENLYTRNVFTDKEYRKRFSSFYKMRFVTPEYRNAFFALFEQVKTQSAVSFEEVARILYQVDNKHEFSFISKMLHTIDPSRPIYDSRVDTALAIHRTYQPDFTKRLHMDSDILDLIREQYHVLSSKPEMAETLAYFDQIAPNLRISTEKKLDFILWALGNHEQQSR